MGKNCSVEGCGRILKKHNSIGVCRKHRYQSEVYREKQQAAKNEWRDINRERINQERREQYKQDPEKFRCVGRAWEQNNRERIRKQRNMAMRTVEGRFRTAQRSAKRRGLEWNLSFQEYSELVSLCCMYCGGTLPPTGAGLDRKDNTKGYELSNVVPCCTKCNKLRGTYLSVAETLVVIKFIEDLRGGVAWPS